METLGDKTVTKNEPKTSHIFECKICDYKCIKKFNMDRHLTSTKHTSVTHSEQKRAKNEQNEQNGSQQDKFMCEYCNKQYTSRNGLWKHNKKCSYISTPQENIIVSNQSMVADNKDDLINYLIKENQEFKNLIMEIVKKDTYTTNNNTTHTNSHNKAFNLQFFLNETCKDAMNINEFIDSIQLQLSDLEKMEEIGFVEGISNIIIRNLNALDISKRPLHCTDKKRETIYIKDQGVWEKDVENTKIRGLVKKVAGKNSRLLQVFKEKHPDYNQYHSKYSTQYNKLVIEAFGGKGDNDLEKEDKIIRNITKNIVVEKC